MAKIILLRNTKIIFRANLLIGWGIHWKYESFKSRAKDFRMNIPSDREVKDEYKFRLKQYFH